MWHCLGGVGCTTQVWLVIGEQGRFWQGFRSRLGARLGTLACGVRAEPSARVTNKDWWLRHMGLPT